MQLFIRWLFCSWLVVMGAHAYGEDWPAYRHDISRSGATGEQLDADKLEPAWTYRSASAPSPAWPGPAKWDAFAGIKNLPSMRNYDPCFHLIAAGNAVYFGSSSDDSVHKLDSATGKTAWSFTTGGPVRIAPMLVEGKLYFGSDDGYAYCVDAGTGELAWRYSPVPDAEQVWNNGRAISFYPVRTGVVVRDGLAYFGASLLPWKESYLVSVDAKTGKPDGDGAFVRKIDKQTMEGAMLATHDQLIIPQGRVAPKLYQRTDGTPQGALKGSGGVFVVVTPDQHILHGPGGRNAKASGLSDSSGRSEKIAAFERGNSLVISGNWAFVLKSSQVVAIDRTSGEIVWQQTLDAPLDLVLAGDTLFVGSEDRVTAYQAEDGTVLWRGGVEGRAHGLAVANGKLLVSTDAGVIHCFREGQQAQAIAEEASDAEPVPASPEVQRARVRGLIGRWVMHRSAMRTANGESIEKTSIKEAFVLDQSGKQHAKLLGSGKSARFGDVEALYLAGDSYLEVNKDFKKSKLPKKQFSVETWVRVDQPLTWGAMIGCIQDNGAFERGWLLGYRGKQFCFGLKSTGGKALTYMNANTQFTPGDWAHVVGTYDGAKMRLYVNGRLETTSAEQSGDIHYPPSGAYVIGAYKDDNEDYRMTGMIHEVRMYDLVLRDRDVKALFSAKSSNFPEPESSPNVAGNFLASGPSVRFLEPGKAEVVWRTDTPSASMVRFTRDDETIEVTSKSRRTDHRVVIEGLRPKSVYQFQITQQTSQGPRTTRSFECDTYFNYTLGAFSPRNEPYTDAPSAGAFDAKALADRLDTDGGLVLFLGFDSARPGYELARQTKMRCIHVMKDAKATSRERGLLVDAGVYGERMTVLTASDIGALRLPSRSFDAVVLADSVASDAKVLAAAKRLAMPEGGVVSDQAGKVLYSAPPLPGAGVWSHMYGTADNSSFGGEHLANASGISELEAQWVGRPGPRYQSDRQNRKPAPLAVNGRLYMQGLHRIIVANQYNGSILWSMEIPEMQRWNVTRDSANWCADDQFLYLAVLGEVWKIQGATGDIVEKWPAQGNVQGTRYKHHYDFGYIARHDDLLIGSSVRPGTIFTDWWGKENWYDQHDGEKAGKVASDKLFALDAATGKRRWVYERGLVINPTICIADDRVFFIRVTNPEVKKADKRRLYDQAMWEGLELVALDLKTGREVYHKEISPMLGVTAFYMVYSQDKLLISSSWKNKFSVHCLEASTGQEAWAATFGWEANHHGKHLSRPAVSGNHVYLRPKVLDLQTGKELDTKFPRGHQCGSYALTTNAWFGRAGNTTMWSINGKEISSWDRMRPDCWISTIPAGGMVLAPEGGGGCSCGTWIETSIAFMPKVHRRRGGEE